MLAGNNGNAGGPRENWYTGPSTGALLCGPKSSLLLKQNGGGRHFGFCKHSHNFTQDREIWLNFFTYRYKIWRWIGPRDQKFHLNKIQDGGGRHYGFHQSAISTPWMGAFSLNLVRWCRMTPCSRNRGKNHHFLQKQDGGGRHLWFWKITKTCPGLRVSGTTQLDRR